LQGFTFYSEEKKGVESRKQAARGAGGVLQVKKAKNIETLQLGKGKSA
jgi:hypothetical protein